MSGAPQWLSDPGLAPLWDRVRDRLESSGGVARGRVTVRTTTREQRHAVGGVLGSAVVRDQVSVDLAALERRLVERTAFGSLAALVESVTERPLRNRPQERADRDARRVAPVDAVRGLVDGPWVESWLSGLLQTGILARAPGGEELAVAAATVVREVLAAGPGPRSRVELAARVLGDAHALDEDRLLHNLVVRALAAEAGIAPPAGLVQRRALWERHGVTQDSLSATCLLLGLEAAGSTAVARRLAVSAGAGDPVHITAWDLRRGLTFEGPARDVLVCENPRVLEAVAEAGGGGVGVVCSSGQPNGVVMTVLGRLRETGHRLRYHGDFDWPGIAIANRLVAVVGVAPWLMEAEDYEGGLHRSAPPLSGTVTEPSWSAELGAAMRSRGTVVHEETVLDDVLAALPDLRGDGPASG